MYNAGFKGLLEGFKQGWYDRYSVQLHPQCLGEESLVLEYQLYDVWVNQKVQRYYEIPTLATGLYGMLATECHIWEVWTDVGRLCRENDTCGLGSIFRSSFDHTFQFTSLFLSIAEIYELDKGGLTSLTNFQQQMSQVGADLGRLLSLAFKSKDPERIV